MAIIIDGKRVANLIKEEVRQEVKELKESRGIVPGLATILVGEDPASQFYVNTKKTTCEELGMHSEIHSFPKEMSQEDLIKEINKLNLRENIHGILVQLPLPKHINQHKVIDTILYSKDVDGLNSQNIARQYRAENDCFEPCTPKGIIRLLNEYKIPIQGEHVVIIGRSPIVGKPLATMMSSKKRNATVIICHSKTKNLEHLTRGADILICAIGKPQYITKDMVKEGAVVIDVGVNRIDDPNKNRGYRLVGDVDFENVKEIVSYITPVPGGVGPMTIACLMENTLKAAQLLNY